jgi:hypothetical protein
MKTRTYRPISSDTFFLRILNNVSIDKEKRVVYYTRLGVNKTATVENGLYQRLYNLTRKNCPDHKMAMSMKNTKANKGYIVIDRAFYDEF